MLSPLPSNAYDAATLTWIQQVVAEGMALLKQEPAYGEAANNIAYVMGDQLSRRHSALSSLRDNHLKKIVTDGVAALTDIHPLFGFQTFNSNFEQQVVVLDKLTRAWWVNNYCDLRLADVVRYSQVCGTGYCEVNWDRTLAGGKGDIVLTPVDPRDVYPIAPKFDFSIQSWGGVIIQSMETVGTLQQRYGDRAAGLTPDRGVATWTNRLWGGQNQGPITTPSVIDSLNQKEGHNMPGGVPAKVVYKIYYHDDRMWTGEAPITMGTPGTNWAYTVYPVGWRRPDGSQVRDEDSRLYPRGRCIVATRDRILFDGPNPYWHGMFPIVKLTLDPWPWSLWGASLVGELRPLQDALNDLTNGYLDHCKKLLRPLVKGDKNAVPASVWNRLDTRLPGQKLLQNPNAGKGIEFEYPEALPPDVKEMIDFILMQMDQNSGVANLNALTELNQMPAGDSIEKLIEALSPPLRLKGRVLEVALRELGEMVKSCFFQFYTLPRRVAILGDVGVDMQDFDFDPGTLIPALSEDDPNYVRELDHRLPITERAIWHNQNFTFQITPNSLLAISQLSRKLTYLQLWRGGLMDPWSLFEVLEIPNAGSPPPGAETIIQRIMAANMMGLSGNVSPAGRKASGQAPPEQQVKADENGMPRTVMSESG